MDTTETRASSVGESGGLVYDGFISYSHAADDLVAPRLQESLQRFAKPWWKRRALRIFRDETSLSANPHLWSSITEALDHSDWFVLLLSPDAAASEWVNKEVEYWLAHKDRNRIIPVVTEGEFIWSASDGDLESTAAPPALYGVFTDEPRWVDLRFARTEEQLDLNNASFRAAIADIASAIRQVPKDELESEEVRQHRRTTRTAWAAAIVVVLLLVAATGAAAFAVVQSNEARDQRDEAQRQTAIAQEQTRLAEEQQREAEIQTEIAQQERDRAELNAMETISTVLITESNRIRATEPTVADLLAVEARRRIDIELTRANLARRTLSASSVARTRLPPNQVWGDIGPDGTWNVGTYNTSSGGFVADHDLVAQRPGDLRYDLPVAGPNPFQNPGPFVDLSEDGSRLVVWYRNVEPRRTEAVVLDATTFDPVGLPLLGNLSLVEISPDGSLLAVTRPGGEPPLGTVDLVTATTGEIVASLPDGGDGQIHFSGLEFSSDGSRLVTQQFSSDTGVVKVWDVASAAMLFRQEFEGSIFEDNDFVGPAISQDGRYVAVAAGGVDFVGTRPSALRVTVLDGETGAVVAEIALDTFGPDALSVEFGAVQPVLAIGDSSGVSIVSTETFEVIRRIDHATGAEYVMFFRDADRKLLVAGGSNEVVRFDLTVAGTSSVGLPVAGITALSPVGDTIAVVEFDGSVSFWSARSGEQVGASELSVPGTGDLGRSHTAVSGIGGVPVFSADGELLYVRDGDGKFSVVEVSTGDIVAEIDLVVGRTHNALAASGAFIATGHSDGRVMLWDEADFGSTDEPVAEWQLFDQVGSCAPTSDPTLDGIRQLSIMESTTGLLLRAVDQCGVATGWEVVNVQPTNTAAFPNSLTVGFGPDDSYVMSQLGTRLRLLAEDGTEIRDLDAHREEILQTSTSQDQGTMASVSRDLIGFWYTRSGESLASGITGAQAHVAGDGSFAVTSGGAAFDWFGGPVVVWDLDPDTWEEQTCQAAGRNLSFFEWQQFFPNDQYRVTCPQWPSGLEG